MIFISLPLVLLCTGVILCAPEHVFSTDQHDDHDDTVKNNNEFAQLDKKSPVYDFGLGKRAYSYVSEYKRLPVYNFGLGKRSRLYSFGLGKRIMPIDDDYSENMLNDNTLSEIMNSYEEPETESKRARPYSFGLGKRDESEEKRGRTYAFGLGKRLPKYGFGLGKRGRSYSFGLGKRLNKYNFGMGKRELALHKYNFGLGKRSDDYIYDSSDEQ